VLCVPQTFWGMCRRTVRPFCPNRPAFPYREDALGPVLQDGEIRVAPTEEDNGSAIHVVGEVKYMTKGGCAGVE